MLHACSYVQTSAFKVQRAKTETKQKADPQPPPPPPGLLPDRKLLECQWNNGAEAGEPAPHAVRTAVGLHPRSPEDSLRRLAALPRLRSGAASAPPLAPGPRVAGRGKPRGGLLFRRRGRGRGAAAAPAKVTPGRRERRPAASRPPAPPQPREDTGTREARRATAPRAHTPLENGAWGAEARKRRSLSVTRVAPTSGRPAPTLLALRRSRGSAALAAAAAAAAASNRLLPPLPFRSQSRPFLLLSASKWRQEQLRGCSNRTAADGARGAGRAPRGFSAPPAGQTAPHSRARTRFLARAPGPAPPHPAARTRKLRPARAAAPVSLAAE